MVSTDIATPEATQSMIANGLTEGHLNSITNVDYNTFTQFLDYSHQIDFTAHGPQLYDLFKQFPTMDMPFSDVLHHSDMPAFDPTLVHHVDNYIDPFFFDYSGLDLGWLETPVDG